MFDSRHTRATDGGTTETLPKPARLAEELYQLVMSPVSVAGYVQEPFKTKRNW
jgi:hypothetical protein